MGSQEGAPTQDVSPHPTGEPLFRGRWSFLCVLHSTGLALLLFGCLQTAPVCLPSAARNCTFTSQGAGGTSEEVLGTDFSVNPRRHYLQLGTGSGYQELTSKFRDDSCNLERYCFKSHLKKNHSRWLLVLKHYLHFSGKRVLQMWWMLMRGGQGIK